MKKTNKVEFTATFFVYAWIIIANIIALNVCKTPTWPMFMVTVFFYWSHGDKKNIPNIAVGGIVGLVCAYLFEILLGAFAPSMGGLPAAYLTLIIILGILILGGTVCPVACNNFAIGYFTIALIDSTLIKPQFTNWLLMFIIGGGILLAGAILAGDLGVKLAMKGEKKD